MHVLDMSGYVWHSDIVSGYVVSLPMASLVTSNQSSLLTKNRSLCKRTVTCNIYCTLRHFSYHFRLLRSFDILSRLCSSWVLLEWPPQEESLLQFCSCPCCCHCSSLHSSAGGERFYDPQECDKSKRSSGVLVAVGARLWRLLLLWVHFLFFILHTQPPFQSISFVLSCCQEESSPLKVSNNNKAAFLAFVLCPGHSDETSHSTNLFVCSFICDLPLETKDLNTSGIIQHFHLWFESSLYVTVLCNFFHKKWSSGFHSYP